MPVRQGKRGRLSWVDPTPKETQVFLEQLQECTFVNRDIDSLFKEKVAQLTSQTVLAINKLGRCNKKTQEIVKRIVADPGPVDIIVPVHNSVHIVLECLDSIVQRTHWPHNIIIVDDASDSYTNQKLVVWAGQNNAEMIRNKKNKGFPATVNRGLRHGKGKYVCALNSDVIVTDGWLTKMVMTIESDEKAMIVNPCTNNTALIDVPMVPGASYLDMNRALEVTSEKTYPQVMPTGFCFFTYRRLLDEVGYFDEAYGRGYGEETDWWMRVITRIQHGEFQKWKAVLADDTYLYHERGSSFSSFGEAEKMVFRKAGAERFHKIWPGFKSWQQQFNVEETMRPLRTQFNHQLIKAEDAKYSIAFVVHSVAFCGGMKVICDFVNHLLDQNVNAKVVHIKRNIKDQSVPLGELRCAPIVFNTAEEFIKDFNAKVFSKGIVVAATNELTGFVKQVCRQSPKLTSVLFAQSHDPLIAQNKESARELGRGFSLVDHIITNSKWLSKDIKRSFRKTPLGFVRPGVDLDLFYPGDREIGDDRPTIMFYLNKDYPFRGSQAGSKIADKLLKLAKKENKEIRLLAYGADAVSGLPAVTCHGRLPQVQIARLLRTEVDLFIDPSSLHTYGMPALEALVSGVPVVSWDNKGISEYAQHEVNAMILKEDASTAEMAETLWKVLFDEDKREALKQGAIALRHEVESRKDAAINFQNLLETSLNLRAPIKRKIAIVTPHLRKYGGPTTLVETANGLAKRGHDVSMYTVYPDVSPVILKTMNVPLKVNWDKIEADVAIINSDNPASAKIIENPNIKKKIMLKLSHNPRFFELENNSLGLEWDKIITSTRWLANACKNPEGKWDHPPKDAAKVGWFHYSHDLFAKDPTVKTYNIFDRSPINIGTLVHAHPLKGSEEALTMLHKIKEQNMKMTHVFGVGEVPEFRKQCPPWMQYFYNLTREQMAQVMGECDIWVSASKTEGLGRLALEAMSASCAIIMFDTGAEFAKHEENCILVPQGDVDALQKEIERVMKDLDLRKTLAKNAFKTAIRCSNSDKYINNVVNVIEEVLNEDN